MRSWPGVTRGSRVARSSHLFPVIMLALVALAAPALARDDPSAQQDQYRQEAVDAPDSAEAAENGGRAEAQ